ncbi:MAG: hypothetical protein ACE5F2_00850 [Candidatus Paceibacteria bacterium]
MITKVKNNEKSISVSGEKCVDNKDEHGTMIDIAATEEYHYCTNCNKVFRKSDNKYSGIFGLNFL